MKEPPGMCMKTQETMTKCPAKNTVSCRKMPRLSHNRQKSVGFFGQNAQIMLRIGAKWRHWPWMKSPGPMRDCPKESPLIEPAKLHALWRSGLRIPPTRQPWQSRRARNQNRLGTSCRCPPGRKSGTPWGEPRLDQATLQQGASPAKKAQQKGCLFHPAALICNPEVA